MHAVPHLVLRVLVLYLCTRTHVHRTRAKFNAFARSPHMVIDKFKLIMHHSAQAMDVDTQPLFSPQSHEHTDYTKTQSDGDKLQPLGRSQLHSHAKIHIFARANIFALANMTIRARKYTCAGEYDYSGAYTTHVHFTEVTQRSCFSSEALRYRFTEEAVHPQFHQSDAACPL